MDCKGKTKAQCKSDSSCQWVNAATPYCRRKPGRALGQSTVPGMTQALDKMTLKELKSHPVYKEIQGRSSMNKAVLLLRMKAFIRKQARAIAPKDTWPTKCKVLEEKCPMSTTLLGDDWCDVDKRDVIYTKNYDACFEYTELLRVIHEGFIAQDTSYEIPQLRLKLPRDPVRQFIPKKVIMKLLLNKKAFEKHIMEHPVPDEVLYFLVNIQDFYKTFDKPAYKSMNMNSVVLSKDIRSWLEKFQRPAGGLRLERYNDRQDIKWVFRQPEFAKTYQLDKDGTLKLFSR